MEIKAILAEIDAEISRLQQAKTLLSDTPEKRKPGRPASKSVTTAAAPKKRQISAEGRARIAAAQKARWAAAKKKAK